jgi:hypothetical protein
MNEMKLQKRTNSKSYAEAADRAFCRMMGVKYPIISARKWKKIQQIAEAEYLSTVCPN